VDFGENDYEGEIDGNGVIPTEGLYEPDVDTVNLTFHFLPLILTGSLILTFCNIGCSSILLNYLFYLFLYHFWTH